MYKILEEQIEKKNDISIEKKETVQNPLEVSIELFNPSSYPSKIKLEKSILTYTDLTNRKFNFFEEESFLLSEEICLYNQLEKIDSIKNFYTLKEEEKVKNFILENFFLVSLLTNIYYAIKDYFPQEELLLKMFTDSEEVKVNRLIVAIKTELSSEEAYKRIKSFRKNWWLNYIEKTKGLICIITEFI